MFRSFLGVILCAIGLNPLLGQGVETDSLGFETFTYQEGDTSFTMKKYFMVFLKSGPDKSKTEAEAMEIQKKHLAHISWMADEGYLDIAGPFADDGDIRGIFVLRVPNMQKAKELTSMDPAVQAGRLTMEIHPWWAAVGSTLK